MARGDNRRTRVMDVLQDAGLDALVCTLPANVLMLSGYWPVVGSAVALATRDGHIAILAPDDERELAEQGWATEIRTYQPGSLARVTSPAEAVRDPLALLLRDLRVNGGHIGYEEGDAYEPATYAAMYLYGTALPALLQGVAQGAALVPAREALTLLRSIMMPEEVVQVRLACTLACTAFTRGARGLRAGLGEPDVAAAFARPLSVLESQHAGIERAGGFTYCMSGPNSALAGRAYARTRAREMRAGDLVLVHCNSYVDGYWTDITRTYCLGTPDQRQGAMYEAVFAARAAALAAIYPGGPAKDLDRAARDVLTKHGFGQEFTHGLGHNVGFSAISTEFPPRLHPASNDRLEVGMTFNVEPAIYIRNYGGIRHCDVVTLGEEGAEVLTPFQSDMDHLIIHV